MAGVLITPGSEPDVPSAGGGYLIPADASAAPPPPSTWDQLTRQGGLLTRYLAEGAMALPNLPFDAAVKLWNMVRGDSVQTPSEAQARLMNQAGLPNPETPTERMVGDISRTLVPVGGQIKAAGAIAENAVSPVVRNVAAILSQAPAAQAASGTTSAVAGGTAREMGATPEAQFAASLVGGMAPALAFAPAAIKTMRPVAPLADDAAARAAAMADIGITNPPAAAVTRSPQDWAAWRELGKREGPAKDLFVTRGQQINDQLAGALPDMRLGAESTPYAQSEAARQAVVAYKTDARNIASGTYQAAAKAPGAESPFPAGPFWQKAQPILDTFADYLPGVVKTRLQQLQAGGMADQGEMPAASGAPPRPFTVGEAANLYELINATTGTAQGPAKAAGSQLKAALADAGSALPGAPGTAMQLFKDATYQWRTIAQNLSPTPIASLAKSAEAKPNFLTNLFTNGKPGEIAALSDMLQQNIPAAADGLHDALIDYLHGRAVQQNGRFSGVQFANALDDVGPERLAAVLSPEEVAKLQSLRTASEALTTEPNLANVNRSNTASTLLNRVAGAHLGTLAGTALGHVLGGGELVGGMAGYAAEELGKQLSGSKMAGMYGVPGVQPSLQQLLESRVLPWVTGASVGSAQQLSR